MHSMDTKCRLHRTDTAGESGSCSAASGREDLAGQRGNQNLNSCTALLPWDSKHGTFLHQLLPARTWKQQLLDARSSRQAINCSRATAVPGAAREEQKEHQVQLHSRRTSRNTELLGTPQLPALAESSPS